MNRRRFLKALPVLAGAAPAIVTALAKSRPTLTVDEILNDCLKGFEQACVPMLASIEHFQDRDSGLQMYRHRYSDGSEFIGVWVGLVAYAPQSTDLSAHRLPK